MNPEFIFRTLVDPILQRRGTGTVTMRDGFLTFEALAIDMPRIVGRSGANLHALKAIFERPGYRLILTQSGPQGPKPPPVPPRQDWTPEKVKAVISSALTWQGLDPRVHANFDGKTWRFTLMERITDRVLYESLTLWAKVCASAAGGNLDFADFYEIQGHAV